MQIVFLARWYPDENDPMFGLFVQRHAEAVSLKHNVSVIYISEDFIYDGSGYRIVTKELQSLHEIRVYYQKSASLIASFAKLVNLFRFYQSVGKGMNEVKRRYGMPQLLHVHILTRLGVYALYIHYRHHLPYIITEHWSRYLPLTQGFKGVIRKLLTRWVVREAKAVTTVTQNLALAMQNHGLVNRDYLILPNVVELKLFDIQVSKPNSRVRMIHISCFEDQSKNVSGLLRVLRRLSESYQDFECILVGEGVDFQELQQSAWDLIEKKIVQFTGLLQGIELAETLKAADFMVLFSHYENMPVVILEAFACGLPVVATRVGGIPEMVNLTNGILVEAGNEEQLASAIIQMKENVKTYDPKAIRKQVVDQYGYEAVAEFLDAVYRKALENRLSVKNPEESR